VDIINKEEAQKEFIKFTENYDLTIDSIKRKQEHSIRVMELCEKIAIEEGFSKEETEIAIIIGLLHDIARFKQYTEYTTFRDDISFDHGDVAIDLLEKDNNLRKFIKTDKFDNIIKTAIKNHNKLKIEDGLNEEEEKYSKIIRDADKIDIIYQATKKFIGPKKEEIENAKVNPEIKNEFDAGHIIDRSKYPIVTGADRLIQLLTFIFDMNYKSSFKILKQEEYINKLINQFKFEDAYTAEAIIETRNKANEYILNKIQK